LVTAEPPASRAAAAEPAAAFAAAAAISATAEPAAAEAAAKPAEPAAGEPAAATEPAAAESTTTTGDTHQYASECPGLEHHKGFLGINRSREVPMEALCNRFGSVIWKVRVA
jgi:hypothetical protein